MKSHALDADAAQAAGDDIDALIGLNDAYLEAVKMGDVDRFGQLLADDFLCSTADGALLDKRQFLELTAGPRTLRHLSADDVRIRRYGDVAIINAATYYETMNGDNGHGRYTDIWSKRDGTWRAVSAHVTRL